MDQSRHFAVDVNNISYPVYIMIRFPSLLQVIECINADLSSIYEKLNDTLSKETDMIYFEKPHYLYELIALYK